LRVMLGLILLIAAGLKAHQLATDPLVTLAPSSPLPLGEGWVRALAPLLHSRPFLIALVEIELLFGLVLLWGIYPQLTWALSLGCFGSFALISLSKALSGAATCGCFGRVPVNPWYTFALDATAVLALVGWPPHGESPSHVRPFARYAAVVAVWLVAGTPVALATWTEPAGTLTDLGEVLADGRTVILKPQTWVGQRFALADWIDIGDRLGQGEWVVLLYHRGCPKCEEALAESEKAVSDSITKSNACHVAWIQMPPYGDLRDGNSSTNGRLVFGRLNLAKNWFASTPVEIMLSQGVVRRVKGG